MGCQVSKGGIQNLDYFANKCSAELSKSAKIYFFLSKNKFNFAEAMIT